MPTLFFELSQSPLGNLTPLMGMAYWNEGGSVMVASTRCNWLSGLSASRRMMRTPAPESVGRVWTADGGGCDWTATAESGPCALTVVSVVTGVSLAGCGLFMAQ